MSKLRLLLAVLVPLWLMAAMYVHAAPPQPVIKIENPGACIAPASEMRRNHKEMLRHQRDRTVHEGIRGEKASLRACINCHASKTTGSVLGNEGFCQTCHSYAAVRLDCWDCHQPRIGPQKATGATP